MTEDFDDVRLKEMNLHLKMWVRGAGLYRCQNANTNPMMASSHDLSWGKMMISSVWVVDEAKSQESGPC
jgi:hypothetical protein